MRHPHTIPGNYAATGAVSGAWAGWLLGLCVGVGVLSLPELGFVLPGGSVAMAFLAGSGGTVAGTLMGGLVGALIGRRHGRLSSPTGLTFDANGDLFIANSGNGTISEVTPGGKVSTFASGLSNPQDLIFDSNGNLFVANMPCGKPRKRTSPSVAPWRKW